MSKTTNVFGLLLLLLASSWVYLRSFDLENSQTKVAYEQWKKEYNIVYSTLWENEYRLRVFTENLKNIQTHNSKADKTYTMGVNQFTAMSPKEFIQSKLNFYHPTNPVLVSVQDQNIQKQVESNDIDWVEKGAVRPAENMGQCAASWTFVTIATIQALNWSINKKLVAFSVQMLLDCCSSDQQSCRGGFTTLEQAYNCVKNKGITTADRYPYRASQGVCKIDKGEFIISGHETVKGCDDISKKLRQNPLSVYVDASKMISYKSGIYNGCSTPASLNHLMTLVGQSGDFWKLKNQWGTSWGEQGFIRLAKGNTCGVCYQGSLPYKN